MFFSASTCKFYDAAIHGKSIPSDAKPVNKEVYLEMLHARSIGKIICADENGFPVANDPSAPLLADILEGVKAEIRQKRAGMLDALSGIAGRAARSGNIALADEADAIAIQLLEITDDVALNAATTYESMQAAGVAAYKRMAASSSPELASVFREITGA